MPTLIYNGCISISMEALMNRVFLSLLMIVLVSNASATVPAEAMKDLKWRLVGPLRAGWSICAEGVPEEPNTFYFGGADGGVWKTTDAGITWQPIADGAPFSSVGALAISQTNPRTIYVGTGHVDTRYDVMDGTGVYKSEDDGRTWTSLGLTDTRHIGRIQIDPRNPKILHVAALGHLFGPNADRGVYRSEDGGGTWKKVLFVDENTGAVDLTVDPATPDTMYAAMWQVRELPWLSYYLPPVGPGSGVWKSIDGGKTWKQTSRNGLPEGALGRIGLAVAPGTSAKRLYATVHAVKNAGIYRTDDGGENWKLMNSGEGLASNYFGRITADITNPEILYVTGQSIRKTTDGGKTFTFLKGSPGGDDYHWLWINPKLPDHMITASDQGTAVTINGGNTWSPWYNQATGQFYHLATDNQFPYWIYSGQQDSGTVRVASRSDYGQLTFRDWNPVGGDERDYDIPFPSDPNVVFGSGLGGRLSKWDARTGRVSNVSPWPEITYGKRPNSVKYRYNWITPIAISSFPPHAVYQGAQVLFRSLDQGEHWQIISPDLSGKDPNAKDCDGDVPVEKATSCGFGSIFSIAPSSVSRGVLWIGTDNGKIQLTRNEGKSWADVTPSEIADWSKIVSIDASAIDAGTAYAAVERHRRDDWHPYIYRTHDFGKNWKAITSGLPENSYVNVVRQDPHRKDLLYAGTRTGVFVSFDDGENWQSMQLNLPRSGINDLLVHDDDVILATQGRSLWVLDNVTPLRHLNSATLETILFPPAKSYRLSKNENRDTPLPPEIPTTPNPPTGVAIDYILSGAPAQPVRLEILNQKGELLRTFSSADKPERPKATQYFADRWLKPLPVLPAIPGHNRFVWDLRLEQPRVAEYDFSIAAVPGDDSATIPQGIMILPGKYSARLTVDGKTFTQPVLVEKDPRSKVKPQDLESEFAFYKQATQLAAANLEKYEKLKKDDAKKYADFISAMDALTGLIKDLEDADGPPTGPQRELFADIRLKLK
jgi:photosystem II stability/assembly factor-like uncharacterized protein